MLTYEKIEVSLLTSLKNPRSLTNTTKQLRNLSRKCSIFSPSLHQAFDAETEAREKQLYEEAEAFGKSGGDCELQYGSKCKVSPLHKISKFIHPDSNEI